MGFLSKVSDDDIRSEYLRRQRIARGVHLPPEPWAASPRGQRVHRAQHIEKWTHGPVVRCACRYTLFVDKGVTWSRSQEESGRELCRGCDDMRRIW